MYERVSCLPFSQEVRGLLDYYPNTLKTSLPVDFLPEIILADNWEFVYETFLTEPADVGLVARCCRILSQHPAICQPFLQLLIDQLNRTDKDSQYGN